MTSYEAEIRGFVQGQGIRPALRRLANERRWTGHVRNTVQGVLLTLGDVTETTSALEALIRQSHPALAGAVMAVHATDVINASEFRIADSTDDNVLAVPPPHDAAVCAACLVEFDDPGNRRFRDPLISCVRCGPRFSAVQTMPFDRSNTTLKEFTPCAACAAEYQSSGVRRGHSQTISCPNCGPRVWAEDRHGKDVASGDAGCLFAAQMLRSGHIVAVRGVGGYQLLVEATDNAAVNELRQRKGRMAKPFAVLCRTVDDAEGLGQLDPTSRRALTSPANPIVIVPRRSGSPLAASVHPHLSEIGLLLPTTALHARLLDLVGRPLVCTSGNQEGAPLAVEVDEARSSLAGIADAWLHHNRPIAHPVDESVVRPVAGRVMTLRCARGLAPLPLHLPDAPPAIALGAFQKSACAYSNGAQAVLGPYVGDLDQIETRSRWEQSLISLRSMYGIETADWAVDAHPDDVTHAAVPTGTKATPIWHHHAHLAAVMLEHGWTDRPVMGFAADGQGYGPDGALWGGEVLQATMTGFARRASVRRFSLCGGEAAVRDPARLSVVLLSQLPEMSDETLSRLVRLESARTRGLLGVLRSSCSPQTSSLGRFMDGVAWIVLGMETSSYVGEPAIRLEAACDPRAAGAYAWRIDDQTDLWELDWRPVLRAVLKDLRRGELTGVIAERFHRGIADCILELRHRCPELPWVFGGGVFQNRRLCELLMERWPSSAPALGLPGVIPPNDGGLAAGQLAVLSVQGRTKPVESIRHLLKVRN